jgi:hypothetical protein
MASHVHRRARKHPSRAVSAIAVLVTAGLSPILAHAQTSQSSPTVATPWDSTVVVGLLSGRPEPASERGYADDWFNAAELGGILGRHLTPHAKIEVALSTSREGRRFVERYIQPPSYPFPVPLGTDEFTRVHEVGASFTYQFFENEWVHPFVQLGAGIDIERVRTHTWPQSFFTGDPRLPGSQVVVAREGETGPVTIIHGRAVVGAGAKFYVTPRVFVRTEGRFAAGGGGQHLSLRAGVGVDF